MATAKITIVPAPKRGWNARDPLSAMKPDHAVVLENFIPGTSGVDLRTGHEEHADGIAARVATLMVYSAPSGGNELFAASGEFIYSATAAATVNPAVYELNGLGSAIWSYTMFGNSGGNYLVACNGVDAVQNYNGEVWSQPSITGVTASDLIYVTAHAERLWFIEKQSTSAWYLATNAISGAATELDLGSMLNLGGSLVAMASWTRDGGAGADDVAVFISSKGEVILYSGTDPSTAATWQRVGVFKIAPPVGRRCVVKAGADLGIITSQGVIALSTILPLSTSEEGRVAVTNTIAGAFNTAYLTSGDLSGWEIIEYPRKQLMLVNVPKPDGTSFEQFVMNVSTGAWCKFTGWDATCWALMGDSLYFGTDDGRVMVLNDTYLDDGDPISADALPAFSNYDSASLKFFLQARGLFTAISGTDPPIEMKTDYDTSPASVSQVSIPSGGTAWNSPWYSSWGSPIVSVSNWQSVVGYGVAGSPRLKVASQTALKWHETSIMYEVGATH